MSHFHRVKFWLFTSLLLAAGLAAFSRPQGAAGETAVVPPTPGMQLRHADNHSLHLRFVTRATLTGTGELIADTLPNTVNEAGLPALPYYSTYVAIPPNATVEVTVTPQIEYELGHVTIQPAPQVQTTYSTEPLPPEITAAQPDTAVYTTNALFPSTHHTVSEPMYSRDVRLVELRLYPLRYNPVTHTLFQAEILDVTVNFIGANWQQVRPLSTTATSLPVQVINPDQAAQWRSLPIDWQTAATQFPTTADLIYKLTVTTPGIYEVDLSTLPGLVMGQYQPADIAMMYRGEPVAFELINTGNTAVIDTGDKIRFFGWPFDGSKKEQMYLPGTRLTDGFLLENYFWLYVQDNAGGTTIPTISNQIGAGTPITATTHTVVWEPENYFFSTWTNAWDIFPNEPDAWFADYRTTSITTNTTLTKTYTINVPHPAAVSSNVNVTVELMSRVGTFLSARFAVNSHPASTPVYWSGISNVNLTQTVPQTEIIAGNNNIHVAMVDTNNTEQVYVNDVTLTYSRSLIADNQQLIFTDDVGLRPLQVSGFSGITTGSSMRVWNITTPTQPTAITITDGNLAAGAVTFGGTQPANSRYLVTTSTNIQTPVVSRYIPASLTPPNNDATWLAISHANFLSAAQDLAAHRQQVEYGGHTTHVVNIADVIAQYGYGLPLPSAIHAYLSDALNWGTQYVVLFGDATAVPRATYTPMPCPAGCRANWSSTAPTYLITDLVFEDRFQGLIPTDHTFVTLTGSDLIPDMAVGRIPAETITQAQDIVNKIKQFEQNLLFRQDWLYNVTFVADNTDSAGNFYGENLAVASILPDHFNITHIWLPNTGPLDSSGEPTSAPADVDIAYNTMYNMVSGAGTPILNYRGHGSIPTWTRDNRTTGTGLLNSSDTSFWFNIGKPVIILSADCLDGYFAYPGELALSESFLKIPQGGTAAHWSSTGLGTTDEHTVLHRAFYQAIFNQGLVNIGDAINYAKTDYANRALAESELYSFTLQGDPAMRVFTPYQFWLYLPAIIRN